MAKFTEVFDEQGKVIALKTDLTGKQLLAARALNKGSAFSRDERESLKILGKLPYHIETIEEQCHRYYQQYKTKNTDVGKSVFLNNLRQQNETAFYYLTRHHLKEMLPIIYTPTIGEAVKEYSFQFNLPQGLYFSYPNRHLLHDILKQRDNEQIDLIVISDGEGVLGIGDWGIGGMDICVGKLMVYTLCGGINPRRVLPIQIDVGTNNKELLNDPMYLGWRHQRIQDKQYDDFIDQVVATICDAFPNIYLHWEDFSNINARKNLNRYRNQMCTFNDDIQGTGATALACLLSALKALNKPLAEQRIVLFGAGNAGVGIADQIFNAMIEAGLSGDDAHANFWLIDRPGLLLDNMDNLLPFQVPYSKTTAQLAAVGLEYKNNIDLLTVIKAIKPTVLIGCSTQAGAFNETIIKTMGAQVARPIILPLSNPTALSEATPHDLIHWTDGKALVATGSPYPPVNYKGRQIEIAQCNNAFVFPGMGLGVLAARATRVTNGMIAAACNALSGCSPILTDNSAPLLPGFEHIHKASLAIALAVATKARAEGVAGVSDKVDLNERIAALFWQPGYLPIRG